MQSKLTHRDILDIFPINFSHASVYIQDAYGSASDDILRGLNFLQNDISFLYKEIKKHLDEDKLFEFFKDATSENTVTLCDIHNDLRIFNGINEWINESEQMSADGTKKPVCPELLKSIMDIKRAVDTAYRRFEQAGSDTTHSDLNSESILDVDQLSQTFKALENHQDLMRSNIYKSFVAGVSSRIEFLKRDEYEARVSSYYGY